MEKSSKLRWATGVVMGIALGITATSPVGAHVTESFSHLWTEHIKPKLSAPGTVNERGNPVNWGQLKGVPSGFADGVDDDGGGGGGGSTKRTWVIPHVLERAGTIDKEQYTFDSTLEVTYTGGQGSIPDLGPASLDLYLFDPDGTPMQASTAQGLSVDVCNPCRFDFGPNLQRKQSIRIDDLITAKGSFDSNVKLGYGVIVVTGPGADATSPLFFIQNSHTSGFDTSVLSYQPEEIAAPAP